MPFSEKTNVANIDEILTDLVSFAVTHAGFTDEGVVADDSFPGLNARSNSYHMSKNGMYYHLLCETGYSKYHTNIGLLLSKGYNGSGLGGTTHRPRYMCNASTHDVTSNFIKRWFFTDGKMVSVVLESRSNHFVHFGLGDIDKIGTFTGGQVVYGNFCDHAYKDNSINRWLYSSPWHNSNSIMFSKDGNSGSSQVYMPEGYNNEYDYLTSKNTTTGGMSGSVSGTLDNLIKHAVHPLTNRTVMFPNYIFKETNDALIPIGSVNQMRVTNINHITPREIVYDKWQVFPLTLKHGNAYYAPNSEHLAIAYYRDE